MNINDQEVQEELVDVADRLYRARKNAGYTQKTAALHSGVGKKSISSFETRDRISTLKIGQLAKLLRTYGLTLRVFFSGNPPPQS